MTKVHRENIHFKERFSFRKRKRNNQIQRKEIQMNSGKVRCT